MNVLKRFIRDTFERMAGLFHEGPEPPPRLRDEVLVFRQMYPLATHNDWTQFAIQHANTAYRSGFDRGVDWVERDLDHKDPEHPDRILDEQINGWSVSDDDPVLREQLEGGRDPRDPLDGVPPEARAEFFDQLGLMWGTHRVVLVDDDDPPDGRES